MSLSRLHRTARTSSSRGLATIVACLGALTGLLGAGPVRAVDFQAIADLGIEYKNEVRVNASESLTLPGLKKANYTFLQSTVTLNNMENKKKNLVVCVYGTSRAFDNTVTQTELDMTFDANTKTLSCGLTQKQDTVAVRYGQMGCRQVTLAENQKGVAVPFVSGNRRTTIKKVGGQLQIDQPGPRQDGVRSGEKLITAGGAGAGGHPPLSPNTMGGRRVRMDRAIRSFTTRFLLSEDAGVTLATDAAAFNCNKCFGMGSTIGDLPATRTDFFLNVPSDALKMQAKLKVATQHDSIKSVLLSAGGKTQAPFDLVNESAIPVLVTVAPTLVELPSVCSAQLLVPGSQPLSLPPRGSLPATVEFDCGAGLSPGATADVILAMNVAGSSEVLASFWIKARNAVTCDVDTDGAVDTDDIDLIMTYRNTPATGSDDPFDVDRDGMVTVLDARTCALKCTKPFCAR